MCVHESYSYTSAFKVCMCRVCVFYVCEGRYHRDLCLVPTVPFYFIFSSNFSVALFFCWLFSHRLAFRPGFLHKRAEKSGEIHFVPFQIVIIQLQIFSVVGNCQISRVLV